MFIYILGFIFLMLGAYARVGSDLDNQKDHDLLVLKERTSEIYPVRKMIITRLLLLYSVPSLNWFMILTFLGWRGSWCFKVRGARPDMGYF